MVSPEAVVAPAIVEPRLALAGARGPQAPPEDRVIALDVGADGAALEVGQGALDQRYPEDAEAVGQLVEFVEACRGEAARDGFVLVMEDVDGEASALTQGRIALALVIDA